MHENKNPLIMVEIPKPQLEKGEILVRVITCGVCHTELDEIEGRTPPLRQRPCCVQVLSDTGLFALPSFAMDNIWD
jgi:D-arabinose 1-dehydrogenase-like Zn-dependent alcohol dehydrogenase